MNFTVKQSSKPNKEASSINTLHPSSINCLGYNLVSAAETLSFTMTTNRWLLLLILGLTFSLVVSHDGHSEDEHDEEDMGEDSHDDSTDDEQDDKDDDRDDEDDKGEDKTEDEDAPDADQDTSEGDGPEDDEQSHLEHDAFLGDNYTSFKGLSADDTKKQLEKLIRDEIDLNKDGFLTEDEMRARFRKTTKEYRGKEVMETLKLHDEDKDGKISWDEFKKAHFSSDGRDEDNAEQMKEDEQRFKQADIDGDGHLDLKEYTNFYHPGDDERMTKFVMDDNLKKHDTDKDGQISKKEYLTSFNDLNGDAKEELEKDFDKNFDKNKDGKLDRAEMVGWLFPDDEFAAEEPKTLMKEADENKDGKLSMQEILKNYELFVDDEPSTNHDEL